MTIATGVGKKVAYKKETVFGTLPGDTGSNYLRRVSSSLALTKETYESAEIRNDYQVADFRHGARSVTGDVQGELSPGSYKDFIASALRQDWVAGESTGAIATVASNVAGTFTRSAGSFITDGFKVGDIVRWSGWGAPATSNNSRNYRITTLTGAIMTVKDLAGSAATVATKAEGDTVTCTVVGKKTWVPSTGHTNDSYTIEHRHEDISVYEVFTGCRVSKVDISMPASGMSEITVGFMGQNADILGGDYFTSPTAAGTTGILAAVNGKLTYNGADVAVVTSVDVSIDSGMTTGQVVGSNITPDVFVGRVKVSGNLSAYFTDSTFLDNFDAETPVSLVISLSTDETATADFMVITLPKLKLGGATVSDGEQGLTIDMPFTALLNSAGGPTVDSELTTISVQDSTVV